MRLVARQADIQVALTTLDEEGRGVGQADGLDVHVQGGLPGERVRARIDHKSPHAPRAWASLVTVEVPSPDRVAPACPAHPRCGGCVLQCLAYPAQLEAKRARLTRALGRDDVEPVVPSPIQTHYRNKAKYVLGRAGGGLVLGSYAPGTHHLVDMRGCRVPEATAQAVAEDVASRLAAAGLSVYDERRRTGELRYLVVRANHEGRTLVVVVTRTAGPRVTLAGLGVPLVHNVNPTTGGVLFGEDETVLSGPALLPDRVGPVDLQLSARAFFQVHRLQAARLYAEVAAAAGTGRVVDLYSGVGGIALTLAAGGATVVGVEAYPPAVDDARRSAEAMGLGGRAHFELADAAAGLSRAAERLGALDAVVVNPPRKGLHEGARAALLASRPPRLVYVSCGPESLAVDLAALAPAYRTDRLLPFDLLPGTPHVETIAVLERIG